MAKPDLWDELVSFPNLLLAAAKACRGKRSQPEVAAFHFELEKHLLAIRTELLDRTWMPSPFRVFMIREPKPRQISAAPYRDRVVHHALCRILEPIFERGFLPDSYACRTGKGTHAAVRRCQQFARRYRFVLKCDVQKYFPSIDHLILKERIRRRIDDEGVLWLTDRIIDHSNEQEPVHHVFPGDDLLTLAERRRGLPLGNQTSQFFANVYLDPLDHWAKRILRAPGYLRYVDDFALFADDKSWLTEARERVRARLSELRLRLHPDKAVLSRTVDGMRFLGYRVFATHRLLPKENVRRLKRRVRRLQEDYATGRIDWPEVWRSLAGWLGHARQADTHRLTDRLLEQFTFSRRSSCR